LSAALLQLLQDIFERFDRDRSGKIDPSELREALLSLGFAVSPTVLDLLVSKFDKTGGKNKAIEYDNFIEYVLFSVSLFGLLFGDFRALLLYIVAN
jgi:calcium-binding protein CML